MKLTSSKVVTFEVEPIRMRKIEKSDSGEKKVRIQQKEFRGNITNKNPFISSPHTTLGLSTFYWVLIGSASGTLILVGTIFGVCGCRNFSTGNGQNPSGAPSGCNTIIQNDIQLGHSVPRPWSLSSRRKKNRSNNEIAMEDFPGFSGKNESRFKELEGVLTMDEQQALTEKESA